MKKVLFLVISILFLSKFYSQTSNTDSLLRLIKNDKADTTKLNHYNQLSRQYFNNGSFDSIFLFANSALKLGSNIIKEGANADVTLTVHKSEAKAHFNIGYVFYNRGNYPEALKNFLTSLKINEEIGNKKGIASSYNGIGNIHIIQENYDDALINYSASLKIDESLGNKRGVASTYNNIGVVYRKQGNYKEALKNLNTALKLRESLNDILGMADSYGNIGNVYLVQENYAEALKNHFSCLKINQELEDETGIVTSYFNIGEVFFKLKKFKETTDYLQKAKSLGNIVRDKELLSNIYRVLADLESAKGNYKTAFENHKLFILFSDSLDNEESRKKLIQNQMNYDFDKKEAVANAEYHKELENQKALATEKSQKQRNIIIFVAISLLLVIVFSGYIVRSLTQTRKQKNIIELQKNEVELQKHLVEEKQKEIIDSITYAKRLQQAILPADEEVKKHLPDSFIIYKPKDIVAGDFYWLHISPNKDVVFIAAADSTGHGVPGAMVSVVCSNALNRAVNEFNLTDTGKILDKTRDLVLETFAKSGEEIKDGMDISLLSINKTKNQIQWSGANNRLCYIQNNNFFEVKPDKQSIGKTDNPKLFTSHNIELNKGDVFYLMTDGYADQFGGQKGKKYKYKQLQENIISSCNLSMINQQENLSNDFELWKGDLEQVDDVTIIGIRV